MCISYFFFYVFISVYVFCGVWMTVCFSFPFSLMMFSPEEVCKRFSFFVLLSASIFVFVVVVVVAFAATVDLDDIVKLDTSPLSTFTVYTDTVFLFIAGHLFCNNISLYSDSWYNKKSITLSLFLICSLSKKISPLNWVTSELYDVTYDISCDTNFLLEFTSIKKSVLKSLNSSKGLSLNLLNCSLISISGITIFVREFMFFSSWSFRKDIHTLLPTVFDRKSFTRKSFFQVKVQLHFGQKYFVNYLAVSWLVSIILVYFWQFFNFYLKVQS